MVQPALRIDSAQAAARAARALESPLEVERFALMARESAAVRDFMETPEWTAIRARIMGNGKPPIGRANSWADVTRMFRWNADGLLGGDRISPETRRAYLFCAGEVDAYARRQAAEQAAESAPAAAVAPPASAPAPAEGAVGFADALRAVQAGAHIMRLSWAGGTYVTMQAGYPEGIAINANTAQATGLTQGDTAVFDPYLVQRKPCADLPSRFVHWAPSTEDLFATDWRVLERRAN